MAPAPAPWQIREQDLLLHCHVQPGAKQTRLAGLYDGCVKIQLNAPPVGGKANKALIAWLAKLFGVPKSAVEITRGAGNRRKTLRIHSTRLPAELAALGGNPS